MLNPERTVLEEALDTPQRVTEQFVRTLLGCFLFRGDDVFKKVERAERRREEPAGAGEAAAGPAEPAADGRADHAPGHVEHRRAGLRARPVRGHAHLHQPRRLFHPRAGQPRRPCQRRPADALPRRLPVLPRQDQGRIRARGADCAGQAPFQRALGGSSGLARTARPRQRDRKDQKRLEAEQRQARSRERKAQQQIVHRLEKEIQELEARQAEIVAELEKPETYEKPGRPRRSTASW